MIEEKNRAWKEGEKHKGHKTQHKKEYSIYSLSNIKA